MSIRLIGIDLDGTWLREDSSISEKTRDAIQAAINAGYLVVPATGRSFRNSRSVLADYRGLRYFVNANGSVVSDAEENRVLYAECFPYETAKAIYDAAARYDCFMELYEGMDAYVDVPGRDFLYTVGLSGEYADQLLSTNIVEEDLGVFMSDPNRRISKYHIVCGSTESRKKLQAEIGRMPGLHPISVFWLNVEVVNGEWNKARGLERLAGILGLSADEVMVIGDSNNDLDMLGWAGTSVAMGNAPAHVKEIADYVTGSNEEDGIVRALERFIF